VRPRRSAFAAAFLSFIFPGLGHAYIGRWLRALLWAALPILGIAAVAGLGLSSSKSGLVEIVADPDVLNAVLVFLVFDVIYRLLAVLDAYRLARDPSIGSAGSRMLSMAGLIALVVVLVGSHVVLARPVFFATDLYNDIAQNAGDESEVADIDDLAAENPDFVVLLEEQQQQATPDASASPGASDGATDAPPVDTPEPTDTPEPVATTEPVATAEPTAPPKRVEWDGKERLNILLIGHDGGRQGVGNISKLTDTMITISIDPTTGRVAFISLPRDTSGIPLPKGWAAYNNFGGKYNNKINTLYTVARGRSDFPGNSKQRGYNALMGTLGQLYDLDIKYYVSVDLNSFRHVVNTLNGVVVDVQLPLMDDDYSASDGRGNIKLYVAPGITRMNGQDALAYARSRHKTSDFDRSARQQRIISSVGEQMDVDELLQPGVISSLIGRLKKDVKTNIPPKLVPKMVSLASEVDLDRRENLVFDSARYVETCYPCGPSGLWMLKAKPAAMREAVKSVFSTSKAKARAINKIRDEGAVVYVLNGQGGANTKVIGIASSLSNKGMDAVVPPVSGGKADRSDYKNTVITVYNGANQTMPETFTKLKRTFDDKNREVVFVDDSQTTADFVVTVGSKTEGR